MSLATKDRKRSVVDSYSAQDPSCLGPLKGEDEQREKNAKREKITRIVHTTKRQQKRVRLINLLALPR